LIEEQLKNAISHRKLIEEQLETCKESSEKAVRKAVNLLTKEGALLNSGSSVANFLLENLHIIHPLPLGEYLAGYGLQEEFRQAFFRGVPVSPLMPLERVFEHFKSHCGLRVPGEGVKIERCLESFASVLRDLDEGKNIDDTSDLYTVFFAMLMVHSSWHNLNVRPSDRCDEDFFITGCSGCPGVRYSTSDFKRMFKYVSENKFPAPEKNLLDFEKIKDLVLGWPSNDDLKSFQDSQFEIFCRTASDRALHCIRESIFRNANLEKLNYPGEYLRQILQQPNCRSDILHVAKTIFHPMREEAEDKHPIELKILEYFLRISFRLDEDTRKEARQMLNMFESDWKTIRPSKSHLSEKLILHFDARDEAKITKTIEAMYYQMMFGGSDNASTSSTTKFLDVASMTKGRSFVGMKTGVESLEDIMESRKILTRLQSKDIAYPLKDVVEIQPKDVAHPASPPRGSPPRFARPPAGPGGPPAGPPGAGPPRGPPEGPPYAPPGGPPHAPPGGPPHAPLSGPPHAPPGGPPHAPPGPPGPPRAPGPKSKPKKKKKRKKRDNDASLIPPKQAEHKHYRNSDSTRKPSSSRLPAPKGKSLRPETKSAKPVTSSKGLAREEAVDDVHGGSMKSSKQSSFPPPKQGMKKKKRKRKEKD